MAAKIEGNQIVLKNNTVAPSTPDSASALIYPNSSSQYRQIDDAGTDITLASGVTIRDIGDSVSVAANNIIFPYSYVLSEDTSDDGIILNTVPVPTRMASITANYISLGSTITGATAFGGRISVTADSSLFVNTNSGIAAQISTPTTNDAPNGITTPGSAAEYQSVWMDSSCEGYFFSRFYIPTTIASMAVFSGWASGLMSADDIGSTQGVYFRYSTSAGDTNWQCIVHASSANRNIANSGIAVAADTIYKLSFFLHSSEVRFYINGALVAQVDYPTGFGGLGVSGQLTVQTKNGVAKNINIYNMYYESKA